MDKKKSFPMNIGLSSILLIFVVLCLVSFSILSIVSANADKKLSLKFGRYQFLSCQYLHFRADLSLPNFRFTGT